MLQDHVIGHAKQISLLLDDQAKESLPQAYLFYGPAHIGKFTIARLLTERLQCQTQAMCGVCPDCYQLRAGVHLDTMIYPDTDGESLKIEAVRDIIHRVNETPQARYKIILLENIDRLTHEAGNALLKTIEEPSPQTLFICTAPHLKSVLPTLISRMRRVRFSTVPDEHIIQQLNKLPGASVETVTKLMTFVNGRPGRLVKLLQDAESFNRQVELYGEVEAILKSRDILDRFQNVGEIAKDPRAVKRFLTNMVYFLRTKLTQGIATSQDLALIRQTEQAKELLKKNANTRLVLEHLVLAIS